MRQPLLFLSLFFKQNRAAYYEHFEAVRESGAWEAWLDFFLRGIIETDQRAGATASPGIVRETTGRQRGRVFVYGTFLDLLSEGTDPLPR